MKKNTTTILCYAMVSLLLLQSCKSAHPDKAVDRSSAAVADPSIAATHSEVRDLKYTRVNGHNDRNNLFLAGQVFTKSPDNKIAPCGNCIVQLSVPGDTSIHINLPTASDGYFSFEGKNGMYAILLQNPGHNTLEIGPLAFSPEGMTTLRIINATGSTAEKFTVTKHGKKYNWQHLNP